MFSRKVLLKIFAFFICIKCLTASFCGESSLPYYLKITPKNELILGCAKPTCLNFLSGAPSHFSSLENGYFDGFKNMPKYSENAFNVSEKIECDEQFGATKCFKDGEWIGGIHPKTADSENLSFRCCRNSEMKKTKFQKTFDLQTNDNEFIGGDVYERGKLIGFDYISNIVQFENEQGINFEIFVYRISCINNSFINSTLISIDFEMDSDKNNFEKQKLFQSLLAENLNTINNVNGLENINTQNQPGLEGGAICSNISVLTRSGRGIDQSITQLSGTDANENPIISVICTSTNPSTPIVFNWFEQNAFRARSNGIGTITRNLTCYNNVNQKILNQPNESGTNSIVDQVECISGDILLQPSQPFQAPLQQYQPVQPVQQPAYNPIGYQAPIQYQTSGGYPSNMYCFSADTLVTIYDGHKKKRMDELLIGDYILTGDSKNGIIGFSKVTSWIHKKSNLIAEFLKFTLENGQALKITKKHYIYKGDCKNTTNLNNLEMVFAENVSISDCLFTVNKNDELIKTRILKIENVIEKGIYSPLTRNGNIIVNEIFASCYSNINEKTLQLSLPSFTKNVKSVLSSIKFHHRLSSSPSISNEIDLIPGFNFIVQILENFLPLKYFVR